MATITYLKNMDDRAKSSNTVVSFTDAGWRQLDRVNRLLGHRFIRAFALRHELCVYLAFHEAAIIPMDTECQEIRYDGGIYLLLRKTNGEWFITDVISTDEPETFTPVYLWKRIKRGVQELPVRVLIGWQELESVVNCI